MKKIAVWSALILAVFLGYVAYGTPEQLPPAAGPWIEVPVRVFQGAQFVDSLQPPDFTLNEDGQPQKIEAFYLVQKGRVVREVPSPEFKPHLPRTFYLLFQMTEFDPKIEVPLKHYFNAVVIPGDSTTIVTPLKPYNLAPQALKLKSGDSLAKEMHGILRKDIQKSSGEYRSLLTELKRMVQTIDGVSGSPDPTVEMDVTDSGFGLEFILPRYKNALEKLEGLRLVEEQKLLDFAGALKRQPGQKIVFFFYQREFLPEINQNIFNQLIADNQGRDDIIASLQELFVYYNRRSLFKYDRVSQAFADAGINFNFVFMDQQARYVFGITMKEQSGDVFKLFSELARTTGGAMDNSFNPGAGFNTTADHAENYYLLYYRPTRPEPDRAFRKISVTLNNPKYAAVYRTGYYAR